MVAATDAAQLIARVAARTLTPREPMTVDQWADRYRYLTSEASAEPGPWDSNRAPYQRGPMRAFTDPSVDEISLCWASQTGKTDTVLNCVGWVVANDPAPMIWFWPNEILAGEFNRDRVQPAIENSPAWLALRGEKPRDQKTLHIKFRVAGCDLWFKGAGSDAQGKSKPAKYRFADEIDSEQFDPGMLHHARQRGASYTTGAKFVKMSIPSFEGVGIDGELQRSAEHRYHVPCPHCGEYQQLVWANVRWEGGATNSNRDRAERTAHYVCTACGGMIHDHHKPWMLSFGVWVCGEQARVVKEKGTNVMPMAGPEHVAGVTLPTGYIITGEPPEKGRHWGFRLSAIYSPWVRFGALARGWCEYGGEPPREWINGNLAEGWQPKGDRVDAHQIVKQCLPVDVRTVETEKATRARGAYRLGELPQGVLVITGGIDLQRDRAYYTIRGWGERLKQSWLLGFGEVPAPHADEERTAIMLDEVVTRQIGLTASRSLGVSRWAMDSGDGVRTGEVYRFARRHPGRVYACKGQHGDMVLPSRKVRIDKYPDGKPIPGGLTLLHVNTWRYKGMLLGRMRQPPPAMVGHDSSIGDDESRWWWPDPDVDAEGRELRERLLDYFEMLAAEQLVIVNERAVQRGARPEYEWRLRPKRYANHYLDAEVYAWAVAESDFPNITRAYMEALLAKAAAGKAPAAPPATERRRSGKVIEEVRSDYRERYGWTG